MPADPSIELRCPTCARLVHVLSTDFAGWVRFYCTRCKAHHPYPADAGVSAEPRIACPTCGKWLCSGVVSAGSVRSMCHRCKDLVALTPSGFSAVPAPRVPVPRRRAPPVAPYPIGPSPAERDAALVGLIEQRWSALQAEQARTKASLAVGLRFAVFHRDNFRCRYCGRSVDEGAILEADHVMPRSRGGPDTMANLVTACWDCNRGKSDRPLDIVPAVVVG